MSNVERIGVSLDEELLAKFDKLITGKGYSNRSEAIRDMIRDRLSDEHLSYTKSRFVAGVFLINVHYSMKLSH